ncbi:hypothetical protein DKP76_04620 [Falsochrobactrum shanghaiense]|uniref:Uncharacterized protein n=1 Tax=Falsochrobactrum shanghaiense TaxID=2201899 RepID=A0A316JCC3_9HYPH|nr:hypothetical protein DKP76_04620 [Falsochrobactrum shanghaiense]
MQCDNSYFIETRKLGDVKEKFGLLQFFGKANYMNGSNHSKSAIVTVLMILAYPCSAMRLVMPAGIWNGLTFAILTIESRR